MAFTKNFLFTDPVAAQQAVQYAQLAAQEQAQQDQAFNERFRNATQGSIARENAGQQRMLSQSQMQQRAAEMEKDRELQRQGYTSAETIAGARTAQRAAEIKAGDEFAAQQNRKQAQDLYDTGRSYADMLNNTNTPLTFRNKLMESGHVTLGSDGKTWMTRYPMPAPLPGQVESIDTLLQRRQPVAGIPGSMGVGGQLPAAMMNTFPSSSRMMQVVPPTADFPSAPPGPSPFETSGFQVFRQSDLANPLQSPEPWRFEPAY